MTEILSQDEINALLFAVSSGEVKKPDATQAGNLKKIRIYDFRRPDKFSRDHIRTLQKMHETFARLATTMLGGRTGSAAGVRVASVDQLAYEEFIRSMPNPSLLAIVNMKPLPGSVVIGIDPVIAYAIIECVSGGTATAFKTGREHTDIELTLMKGIFSGLVTNLRYCWQNVTDLEPEPVNLKTDPWFAQVVPPNDTVVLITLETKLDGVEGMINMAIPYITLEPVIDLLAAEYMYAQPGMVSGKVVQGKPHCAFYKRYVQYSGAVPKMSAEKIRRLKPGTRIPLGTDADAEILYEYAGIKKAARND